MKAECKPSQMRMDALDGHWHVLPMNEGVVTNGDPEGGA
jgi:hypothetical protein